MKRLQPEVCPALLFYTANLLHSYLKKKKKKSKYIQLKNKLTFEKQCNVMISTKLHKYTVHFFMFCFKKKERKRNSIQQISTDKSVDHN